MKSITANPKTMWSVEAEPRELYTLADRLELAATLVRELENRGVVEFTAPYRRDLAGARITMCGPVYVIDQYRILLDDYIMRAEVVGSVEPHRREMPTDRAEQPEHRDDDHDHEHHGADLIGQSEGRTELIDGPKDETEDDHRHE